MFLAIIWKFKSWQRATTIGTTYIPWWNRTQAAKHFNHYATLHHTHTLVDWNLAASATPDIFNVVNACHWAVTISLFTLLLSISILQTMVRISLTQLRYVENYFSLLNCQLERNMDVYGTSLIVMANMSPRLLTTKSTRKNATRTGTNVCCSRHYLIKPVSMTINLQNTRYLYPPCLFLIQQHAI